MKPQDAVNQAHELLFERFSKTKASDVATLAAGLIIGSAIQENAGATADLLYALKYSKQNGLSVAEALENSADKIAEAINRVEFNEIAEAIQNIPVPDSIFSQTQKP